MVGIQENARGLVYVDDKNLNIFLSNNWYVFVNNLVTVYIHVHCTQYIAHCTVHTMCFADALHTTNFKKKNLAKSCIAQLVCKYSFELIKSKNFLHYSAQNLIRPNTLRFFTQLISCNQRKIVFCSFFIHICYENYIYKKKQLLYYLPIFRRVKYK